MSAERSKGRKNEFGSRDHEIRSSVNNSIASGFKNNFRSNNVRTSQPIETRPVSKK